MVNKLERVMVDPKKQRRFQGDQQAGSDVIDASVDFDRWAKAVREQMLNCLQKRSKHSPD